MDTTAEYVTSGKEVNASNFTRQPPRVIDVKYFSYFSFDDTNNYQLRHVVIGYIMPVMITLGILGNILAIVTFTKGRFKAWTYTYFTCLAVSDLIECVAWIPHVIMFGWQWRRHSYGEMFYHAHVFQYSVELPHDISAYMLLAITVDRYIAVCYPLQLKVWSTRGRTIKLTSLCVVIPALALLPAIFNMHMHKLHNTADTIYVFQGRTEDIYISDLNSYANCPLRIAWVVMKMILVVIHQLAIIILTIRVSIGYRRTKKNREHLRRVESSNSGSSSSSGSYKDTTKMEDYRRLVVLMMCASVINMIFTVPILFLMGPWGKLDLVPYSPTWKVLLIFLSFFFTSNSSINFYVYLLGLRHFRKESKRLLTHVFTHAKKGMKL